MNWGGVDCKGVGVEVAIDEGVGVGVPAVDWSELV